MPTAVIREDLHYASDRLGCKIGLVCTFFKDGRMSEPSTHFGYSHWIKNWMRGKKGEGQSKLIHEVSVVQDGTKIHYWLLNTFPVALKKVCALLSTFAAAAAAAAGFCRAWSANFSSSSRILCFFFFWSEVWIGRRGYWISYGRVNNIKSKRETWLLSPHLINTGSAFWKDGSVIFYSAKKKRFTVS